MASTLIASEFSTAWYAAAQRRRIVLLVGLTVPASLITAGLVLLVQLVPDVQQYQVLLTCLVLVPIAWRPRVGLFVALTLALLFETQSQDPLMLPGRALHLGLFGLVVTPFELLLLLTFVTWLARGVAGRRLDFRGGSLFWPMLLLLIALVVGMARGALAGGNMYFAFWEVRALLYLVFCYALAANTIRARRHIRLLMTITLLATSLYAAEGAYRRFALIDTKQLTGDLVYAHEAAVFLGLALLLVLAQQVFGAPRWQRLLGPVLVPIVGFTLLASERRAGMIGTVVVFLAFALVFLVSHRKAFFLITVPLLVCGAIYLPLFWNNNGLLGQPARAIRSISQPDPRDAASNAGREMEKFNVRATIYAAPLLGIGFGREFLALIPLQQVNNWPLQPYTPHHQILWVWMKTGAIGFIVFWVLMGSAIARAAHLARTLRERDTRTFALLSLGVIISSLVYCYVDTGLVNGRLTTFLGTTMGTLAVLDRVRE